MFQNKQLISVWKEFNPDMVKSFQRDSGLPQRIANVAVSVMAFDTFDRFKEYLRMERDENPGMHFTEFEIYKDLVTNLSKYCPETTEEDIESVIRLFDIILNKDEKQDEKDEDKQMEAYKRIKIEELIHSDNLPNEISPEVQLPETPGMRPEEQLQVGRPTSLNICLRVTDDLRTYDLVNPMHRLEFISDIYKRIRQESKNCYIRRLSKHSISEEDCVHSMFSIMITFDKHDHDSLFGVEFDSTKGFQVYFMCGFPNCTQSRLALLRQNVSIRIDHIIRHFKTQAHQAAILSHLNIE